MYTPLHVRVRKQVCAKQKSCTPWQGLVLAQKNLQETLEAVREWETHVERPPPRQPRANGRGTTTSGGDVSLTKERVDLTEKVEGLISNAQKEMTAQFAKAIAKHVATTDAGKGKEKMTTNDDANALYQKGITEGECPHAKPRTYMHTCTQ